MFAKKILSVMFIACLLLLAACGKQPAVSVTPGITDSGDFPGLYSGPYDSDILPMSIPEICEADRKTFNPRKVYDYLATCDFANHDYFIRSAELKDGALYLTLEDKMYFWDADTAYRYLKEAFSLSDETILGLPEFSGCHINGGYLEMPPDSYYFYLESRMLAPLPVPEDVFICLGPDEITLADFADYLLSEKSKNDEMAIHSEFLYDEGKLTGIYYYDNEEYGVPIDRGDLTDDIYDPGAAGYGSLPKLLLGIEDIPAETFDPDKVIDYLLTCDIYLEEYSYIEDFQVLDGRLSLCITDNIFIDADDAFQYLKTEFHLEDDIIKQLPLFSDCAIHNGKMYTSDQWNYENDPDAGEYEECNLNGIELKELTTPSAVPVAGNAQIILVDYKDTGRGYYLTVQQFIEYLTNNKAEDGSICLGSIWFKCSDSVITALIEEYVP